MGYLYEIVIEEVTIDGGDYFIQANVDVDDHEVEFLTVERYVGDGSYTSTKITDAELEAMKGKLTELVLAELESQSEKTHEANCERRRFD